MSGNLDQVNGKEGDALLEEGAQISQASSQLLSKRKRHIFDSGTFHILIFIPAVVILSNYDESCVKPIREWLIIVAVISGIFTLGGCLESCFGVMTKLEVFASALFLLLTLFAVAWYIVGSVWILQDNQCYDDWPAGYILAFVLMIIFYISLGLVILASCCYTCYVGALTGISATAAVSEPRA